MLLNYHIFANTCENIYSSVTHNYKNNKINNKKGRKKNITEEEKWLEKNTCKECQIPFATMSQFKYHRLKTHGKWQGTFKCEVCLKQF